VWADKKRMRERERDEMLGLGAYMFAPNRVLTFVSLPNLKLTQTIRIGTKIKW
jgi:hypothetical protein